MAMTVYVDEPSNAIANEVELCVEELEEVIAPGVRVQHNETLVSDEVELSVEELEEVIAPAILHILDKASPK